MQRLAESGLADVDGVGLSDRIGAAEGGGTLLDGAIAAQLAGTLGTDPGEIRIHTGGEADALSRELGARAFTSGRDIFFREGAFDPSTPEGFELLAHESTHVLQQAAGPVAGSLTADGALAISDPGDAFEQAATGAGETVAAPAAPGGRPVQRDDDDWSFGSIAKGVGSFVDTAEKDVSAGADVVNTPFRKGAQSIDASTKAYGDFVGWQEDLEHDAVHGIADSMSDIPVLGSVAQSLAGTADTATQLIGGFQEGAVDIAGGMLKTVADPYDAAKGAYNLAQKLPPVALMEGAENAAADLIMGKGLDKAESDIGQGVEKGFNNIWGGITEGSDPANPAGGPPKDAGLVRQILDPFYGDVAKGKSAHAVGRAGATIGSIVFGGELAEAADGATAVRPPAVPEVPVVPEAPVVPEVPVAPEAPAPQVPAEEIEPPTLRDDPNQPPTTLRNNPDLEPSTIKEPEIQISPRNPKFADPGSPGFVEQADPLAETRRPPIEIDPGADSAADTRPQVTQRGLGDPPPQTQRGVQPQVEPLGEQTPPNTVRTGPPEFDPVGDEVPPETLRSAQPEGPLTRQGVAPQANPPNERVLSPDASSVRPDELGSPAGPASDELPTLRRPPVDPDLAPDTLPDGTPKKPNFLDDPDLRQPQPRRGVEPNELPAPDDPLLPEVKPTSPLAKSVRPDQLGSPAPDLEPPVSDPNGPATPNPDQIAQQQDDFEKAWKAYSDEPFGYELLPR